MITKQYASTAEIVRNEEQPRVYFDDAALVALAESLKKKQRQPITVVPHVDTERPGVKWKIVDGERRWRAAQIGKLERVWIVVDEDIDGEKELHTASFVANWNREGHTHEETAKGIDRELQAGRTVSEIAKMVGRSESWVSAEHSLLKLHPDLLKQMDPPTPRTDRIPLKVGYALVQWAPEKQLKLWKKFKGKTGSEVFHHLRTSAPTQAVNRRAGDDANYMLHTAQSAKRKLASLTTLPAAMMTTLTQAQRLKVLSGIREAREKADEAIALFAAGIVTDEV